MVTVGNEQERLRDTQSANIDDRTNHEVNSVQSIRSFPLLTLIQLYLWPFAEAVRANVSSVMCSYNKLNTTWACESKTLLTDLLKDELDFQGYVVSGKSHLKFQTPTKILITVL